MVPEDVTPEFMSLRPRNQSAGVARSDSDSLHFFLFVCIAMLHLLVLMLSALFPTLVEGSKKVGLTLMGCGRTRMEVE